MDESRIKDVKDYFYKVHGVVVEYAGEKEKKGSAFLVLDKIEIPGKPSVEDLLWETNELAIASSELGLELGLEHLPLGYLRYHKNGNIVIDPNEYWDRKHMILIPPTASSD